MTKTTTTAPALLACPDCDLLIQRQETGVGHSLYCPRCGRLLVKRTANSTLKVLTLSLTGLILFFPAILLPLLKLDAFGFTDSANILETIVHLFSVKYHFVACMVALFAVIFPLSVLLLAFTISLHFHLGKHNPRTASLFRLYLHLNEWAMLEVYLLGILVAIIKMLPIADISYLPGFFSFIALVLLIVCLSTVMDKDHFWNTIKETAPEEITTYPLNLKTGGATAASQGLLLCRSCRKLLSSSQEGNLCPRCGASLHQRKPQSFNRTWAFILAAFFLLFPANILPIMEVNFFGTTNRSTILDGIIYFFESRSYFVGAVIFIASVLVPIFKVAGLTMLLLSRRKAPEAALRNKTRLYRFISLIGRWSMLDIFVIALLAATVDFGFISTTYAAPASTWFCLVVAVTMFAAISFDPRIMWDKAQFNTR